MPGKDITNSFIRERQFSPKLCKSGSFRFKDVDEDTSIILCRKKGETKQSVQSILTRR